MSLSMLLRELRPGLAKGAVGGARSSVDARYELEEGRWSCLGAALRLTKSSTWSCEAFDISRQRRSAGATQLR